MTAPTIAPMKPAPSHALYQPSACPKYDATIEPTMPKIVVKTNPDGSLLPGMMNFAATPARNPTMMVQMMLILQLPIRGKIKRRENVDDHPACTCPLLMAVLA